MLIIVFFQIIPNSIAKHLSDSVMANIGNGNTSSLSPMIALLIFLLVVNIIISAINASFNYKIKMLDTQIHRKKLIGNLAIDVEKDIYFRLVSICEIPSGNIGELYKQVIALDDYWKFNQLYLSNKKIEHIRNCLDYFTKLCDNFSHKDTRKENELLNKYRELFNE